MLLASNVVVAKQFDDSKYERRTIVDGLLHNAAIDIPTRAWVFLDHSYHWVNDNSYDGADDAVTHGPLLWDSRYFYRLWGGRSWRTRPLSAQRLGPGEEAYEIRSIANDADRGTLIVEKVLGRDKGLSPVIINAMIYERGVPRNAGPVPAATSAFAAHDFTLVERGVNWRVTGFHPYSATLADDALSGNAASAAQIVYGEGFSVPEDDGEMQWHWAGARASLALINATTTAVVTELRAEIGTIGTARGTVSIVSPAGMQRIEIGDHPRPIRIEVSIPPKAILKI